MLTPILRSALELIGLTGAGYLLFSVPLVRERVLTPLLFLTMNVLLPVYFIDRLPAGWNQALEGGWYWMVGFFAAYFVMIGIHALIGRGLIRRIGEEQLSGSRQRIFLALATVHNAGFIPLPIIEAIAPQAITVYMFMYVLAFSIYMWSVAVPLVSGGGRVTLKLNGPLVGVLLGLGVAVSGVYDFLPPVIRNSAGAVGDIALDCVLVTLGGILATIPRAQLRVRFEMVRLTVVRFLIYPAAVLALVSLVPLGGLSAEMQWGLRAAIILEAAVPPATSLMLAAKRFGSLEDVSYLGSGILFTYIVTFITIPLFLIIATFLLR